MLITIVVALLSLLAALPVFHIRFRFGWRKSLPLTTLSWFSLNTLASVVLFGLPG